METQVYESLSTWNFYLNLKIHVEQKNKVILQQHSIAMKLTITTRRLQQKNIVISDVSRIRKVVNGVTLLLFIIYS